MNTEYIHLKEEYDFYNKINVRNRKETFKKEIKLENLLQRLNLSNARSFILLCCYKQNIQSDQDIFRDLCKIPFPQQPKPKHRFSAVFVSNIH